MTKQPKKTEEKCNHYFVSDGAGVTCQRCGKHIHDGRFPKDECCEKSKQPVTKWEERFVLYFSGSGDISGIPFNTPIMFGYNKEGKLGYRDLSQAILATEKRVREEPNFEEFRRGMEAQKITDDEAIKSAQQKVREEIAEKIEEYGKQVGYDELTGSEALDEVIKIIRGE